MWTTISLWWSQGSEFFPLLLEETQLKASSLIGAIMKKRAGSGDSPLCLSGAAIKLRPWALAWTALQLCCHHINNWACTLLIHTLTQIFRLNIPAWSQTFLITTGLLSGLDSQLHLAKATRSALLAVLRCSGMGSLSARLLPLTALLPSSAPGSLSFREQTACVAPWQIHSETFSILTFTPAEIVLGFYHPRQICSNGFCFFH